MDLRLHVPLLLAPSIDLVLLLHVRLLEKRWVGKKALPLKVVHRLWHAEALRSNRHLFGAKKARPLDQPLGW